MRTKTFVRRRQKGNDKVYKDEGSPQVHHLQTNYFRVYLFGFHISNEAKAIHFKFKLF